MNASNQAMENLVITGLGMVCPVGLDVAQGCGSLRASISRFQETEDYYCLAADADLAEPEPLVCARVPGIPHLPGPQRIAALAAQGLSDLIHDSQLKRADLSTLAVFLVLPNRPQRTGTALDIFTHLEQQTGVAFRAENRAFTSGRTGWFEAISLAQTTLTERPNWRVAILAVDSLLDGGTLNELDQSGRLKSDRNLDGFIPGEAAAAILTEHVETARARQATIRARFSGMGIAMEPHPYGSPGVCIGDGFTEAVSTSFKSLADEEQISWLLTDYNGESHRAREWGNCLVRLLDRLPLSQSWHPAECTGETGAVSAAIACVLAAQSWQIGLAPANHALIIAAEDHAPRAALILARPV